jgi:acyl carrier protein
MDNVESRLAQCFGIIFPELNEKQIRAARKTSVQAWDSVAMVTLINVVEEEFRTQIDLEDVEHLGSFQEILTYIQERGIS